MITTIERKDYPALFEDVREFITEESFSQHRRGSTFFTKSIVHFREEYADDMSAIPEYKDLIGTWETNQYVSSDEDTDWRDIKKLTRVELIETEKVVKVKEWIPINQPK